jgi:hypothetical protein
MHDRGRNAFRGARSVREPNALISTEALARDLDDGSLRIFDCTTYPEPLLTGSDDPYVAVPGRTTFEATHIPGADFRPVETGPAMVIRRQFFVARPRPGRFVDKGRCSPPAGIQNLSSSTHSGRNLPRSGAEPRWPAGAHSGERQCAGSGLD